MSSKFKIICSKDTVRKMKRQPIEWKKKLANQVSDQGFFSRMHKKIITKRPISMGKGFEQMFLCRRHMKGQQAHKRHSTSPSPGKAKQSIQIVLHTHWDWEIQEVRANVGEDVDK